MRSSHSKSTVYEQVTFTPGPFTMLRVVPIEWRNYSIAKMEGTRLDLLISTRTGGNGSIFTREIQPGAEPEITLPFGSFRLQSDHEETHRQAFIATGPGIAPFLRQCSQARLGLESSSPPNCSLITHTRSKEDNIITHGTIQHLPRATVYISRDPLTEGVFHGRVTQVLQDLEFDPASIEFYLCGSPATVDDYQTMLLLAGANYVITEPF